MNPSVNVDEDFARGSGLKCLHIPSLKGEGIILQDGVFVGDGVRFGKFMRIASEARKEKILDHIH